MSKLRKLLQLDVETSYGVDGIHDVPMMSRIKVKIGKLRYYSLHVFRRRDIDVAWHDHKQAFWTFPLRSYVEEVYDPQTGKWSFNIVRAFRRHYRPAEYAHRYMGAYAGMSLDGIAPITSNRKVITICKWVGPRSNTWGFWVPQPTGLPVWTEWRAFVFREGQR